MSNYQIVGLQNHNITLAFDGRRVNFPLPVVDGLYPDGLALTTLLDTYVANARVTLPIITASNLAAIQSLIIQPTTAQLAAAIRGQRNQLINVTDKTQVKDTSLSADQQLAWASYRTALRDLPAQDGFPTLFTWPTPPAVIAGPFGAAITNPDGSPVVALRII